jgi:uncharacterized protein
MKPLLLALLAGLLFAVGLGIAGMTQPSNVLGFLDVTGDWDPSLTAVMAGAIGVHALAYRFLHWQQARSGGSGAPRRRAPFFAEALALPTRRDLDARFVLGAAIFGVGWGLAGLCPGPALVSLATGSATALAFVFAMTLGMLLQQRSTPAARDVPPAPLATDPR